MIKVAIVTLGCSKNQVDGEAMEELLAREGFLPVEHPEEAEAVVVHTCGFIESAREESINTILEVARLKEHGHCRKLIVTGCLAQKYAPELLEVIPEIDGITGTGGLSKIAKLITEAMENKRSVDLSQPKFLEQGLSFEHKRTKGYAAYVKIAEGCNHRCSYCVIPELRGPYVSRTREEINQEVKHLLGRGIKEITLIAQDTTLYGLDLYQRPQLAQLLASLTNFSKSYWLRLLYAYPHQLKDDVLEQIASHERICNYLDIPFQHSEERILKAMGRPGNCDNLLKLVDNIREKVPGITLRSTFIVGFPGETESDFRGLLKFLQRAQLDWAGFFIYSREEGTAAGRMPEQVPDKVKRARYQEAIDIQEQITRSKNRQWIGRKLRVLVEEPSVDRLGYHIGRAERNAPDVDGVVYVKEGNFQLGDFIQVKISETENYDLLGECTDELAQ